MTLFEYLERVKEHNPERVRTRIVLDLNRKIADFCRETKLITRAEDLFTQALVDSHGNALTNEMGESLVASLYGQAFPLPWDCYSVTGIDAPFTYRLEHGVLAFYAGNAPVTFESDTQVRITLHYVGKPALLSEDADEPECHEDFHEGPLYMLLSEYAVARDKAMASYWQAQAELKKQEARVYATSLRRQSYDVRPFDWRT